MTAAMMSNILPPIIRTTSASNYLTRHIKNFGNLSASTGLKQRFGKSTVALFNLGYISRSPNPAELFSDGLHHALATIELGDLRLTQERAMKTLVSLEKSAGDFRYTLTLFNNRINDYIILQPGEAGFDQARNSAFLVREYVQLPQVNMKGFDLDLSYRFSAKFSYKGTAAWVSAKTKEGTPLIDTPPLNIQQQLAYSPIQDNPLRLVFQTAFVAEQTQVPDFNFNYNFFENGAIVSRLVDISSAPTSYHLFGLSVETQLFKKLNLSLVGENLFNVDYRNYLNRLRYFAGETGRNIRVELSYKF